MLTVPPPKQTVAVTGGGSVRTGGLTSLTVILASQVLTELPSEALSVTSCSPRPSEVTVVGAAGAAGPHVSGTGGVVTDRVMLEPSGPLLPSLMVEAVTAAVQLAPAASGTGSGLHLAVGSGRNLPNRSRLGRFGPDAAKIWTRS